MSRKITTYLGLGANLGDRLQQLRQAIDMLNHTKGISVSRLSSVYETTPVGYVEQPIFYNMVIEIQTTLTPTNLMYVCLQVEKKLKRVREIRWGPRTIDIDILLYGDRVIRQPELVIPHPRMAERAFVLVPLQELAGDLPIPGTGRTVGECIRGLQGEQGIRKLKENLKKNKETTD